MQEVINLREAVLGLVLGRRDREVLNRHPEDAAAPDQPPLDGQALSAAIKAAVNGFKAAAMDAEGRTVNYAQLRTSPAYADYQTRLTPQLARYDPARLASRSERLAFWINLYNALVIDAVIAYDVRTSVTSQWAGLGFFRRAAYLIGGQRCSLEDIEHGILRANRGNPFLPGPQFGANDPRRAWMVEPLDPRIHFALNCASRSCPPIGIYSADLIEDQLELATRSFVDSDVVIDQARNQVQISQIFRWYRDDFDGPLGIVALLRRTLPDDPRRAWLMQANRGQLAYRDYDWGLNSVGSNTYYP
ncbi:DUF547 domain-containing protein [Candidatus Viridilinea mediisalina]|uniref:DUF547 domain-containing protein n=2 Tax=Candidatus Viridilinea mediisalina TaxID=2024553 RepID=A0A2A6RI79_9CHLR|nr:DUF547 domain-containing protein [Candidatus Viridilinea mediisalina]